MCELSSLFTWTFMLKLDSQVFVRVNLQGVRVNSHGVRVISKQCTSYRLCGAPPHPGKNARLEEFLIPKNI